MNEQRPGDQVRVTVGLSVPPEEAFRCFTEDINLWWRRGRRFRQAPGDSGIVLLEPGVGGRLFESYDSEAGEQVRQIGRTLIWEPPQRLLLEWRASNFAPHEHTEVEVFFAPSASGGTTVTLTHRGWAAIRADHPVRHGHDVPAFIRMMGLWWGDLLGTLRLVAAGSDGGSIAVPDPDESP